MSIYIILHFQYDPTFNDLLLGLKLEDGTILDVVKKAG